MLTSNRTVRQTCMRIFWLGLTLAMILILPSQAADVSGKWVFVFKQQDGKLSGTYDGPLGEKEVSGTVTGSQATFGFSVERDGETIKVTYTAKIDSPTKMSGTVTFEGAGAGGSGKWTAVKQ